MRIFGKSRATKNVLGRMLRRARRRGDSEAVEKIEMVLANPDQLDLLTGAMEEDMSQESGSVVFEDVAILAEDERVVGQLGGGGFGGGILEFFKYLIDNPEKVMKWVNAIIGLFGAFALTEEDD